MAVNDIEGMLRNLKGPYALANVPGSAETTWSEARGHKNNEGLNEDYLAMSGLVPVADIVTLKRALMFEAGINIKSTNTIKANDIGGNVKEEDKPAYALLLNTLDDQNARAAGGGNLGDRSGDRGTGSMKNAVGMGAAYLLHESGDRLKGTSNDLVSYNSEQGTFEHKYEAKGHGGMVRYDHQSDNVNEKEYKKEFSTLHSIANKNAIKLADMASAGAFADRPELQNLVRNLPEIYNRLQEEQVWSWATGEPIEDSALGHFMKHGELPEHTRFVEGYTGDQALKAAVEAAQNGSLKRGQALVAGAEAGREGGTNQPSDMVAGLYNPPPDENEVSGAAETGGAGNIGDDIDENPLGIADEIQTPVTPAPTRQAAQHISPDSALPETQALHRNGAARDLPHLRTKDSADAALKAAHEAARNLGEHAKGMDVNTPSATSSEADKEFNEVWDKMGMPLHEDEYYDKRWKEMTAHLPKGNDGK